VVVAALSACHVGPGRPAHGVGIVFMLHPDPGAEGRVREARHVACGVHVGCAGGAMLVDGDAVLDREASLLGQFDRRLNAEPRDDPIG